MHLSHHHKISENVPACADKLNHAFLGMGNKTIRQNALSWFRSKFQIENGEIYTSKFYTPQES
jgi:hypothetical protein